MTQGASRERVTARLAQLRGVYDGFDIQQTTLSVDPEEFQRVCGEGNSTMYATVTVTDSEGRQLLIETPEGWRRPGTTLNVGDPIDQTVHDAVVEQTGIETRIEALSEAAIVAIDCVESDDATYQLRVEFTASPEGGDITESATWHADPPALSPVK